MKTSNLGPYNISPQKFTTLYSLAMVAWDYGRLHAYPLWVDFIQRSNWVRDSEYMHGNPSKAAFEIPLDGDMAIEIDDTRYLVKAGELLILPAGIKNVLRTGPSGHCRKLSFGVCGNMVQNLLTSLSLEESRVYRLKNPDRVIRLLDTSAKLLYGKDPSEASRAAGLSMEILVELSEQCAERNLRPELADALRIIEYNLIHNMGVSEIASTLKISRKQLLLLFKEQFGIAPKQYIMDLRMKQAEIMLKQKNTRIKTIASKVGYSSDVNFIREFRKKFGVPPSQYRKMLKTED